jgi:uncharacterized membrane protein YciS (DUF1049 family)
MDGKIGPISVTANNSCAKIPTMNDAPLEETKRGEHRVPRWITALWLAFVVSLALTAIVIAVRLNSDPVRTLGYLVASSIPIFALSAVVYFALYGLSILLEGLDYHKTHCDDSKHWGGMADFMR